MMAYKPMSNAYITSTESFTIGDQATWFYNNTQHSNWAPAITKNANNQPVIYGFSINYDNLENGWIGGNISDYSGLYMMSNGNHNFINNDVINFNGKTCRLMYVASGSFRNYHYLVTDE